MCLQRLVKIRSQTAMDNPNELTVFHEQRQNDQTLKFLQSMTVEDLCNREEADSKAEPTNPSNVKI